MGNTGSQGRTTPSAASGPSLHVRHNGPESSPRSTLASLTALIVRQDLDLPLGLAEGGSHGRIAASLVISGHLGDHLPSRCNALPEGVLGRVLGKGVAFQNNDLTCRQALGDRFRHGLFQRRIGFDHVRLVLTRAASGH
jgi:hypothetical protein